MTDALAAIDARSRATLDAQASAQRAILETVELLRAELRAHEHALTETLGHVSALADRSRVEAEIDRAERRALVLALTELARALSARPAVADPGGVQVIGGSVFSDATRAVAPDGAASTTNDVDIDLAAVERGRRSRREDGVEVRCRFGDRWVGGFEVHEAVANGASMRYRLRRVSDGSILPKLFDASDVRRGDDDPSDRNRIRWTDTL